jgi:hypothetical protein
MYTADIGFSDPKNWQLLENSINNTSDILDLQARGCQWADDSDRE